jgi:DNA-binding MarR family transcriptional regulator
MPAPDPPAPLHDHLGYWLRAVSNAVSLGFARKLEGAGVTVAEWVVLRTLHDLDPIPPSQLAERLGMTRGAISKLADRLAAKDLVQRFADPEDGRAHRLALTPAGHALVPRLAAIADANDAGFFDVLAPADRRRLRAMLEALAAAHGLTTPPID